MLDWGQGVNWRRIIAVVLVVTMTSMCAGCFAPMQPVDTEWRFGQMSQSLNEGMGSVPSGAELALGLLLLSGLVILVIVLLVDSDDEEQMPRVP